MPRANDKAFAVPYLYEAQTQRLETAFTATIAKDWTIKRADFVRAVVLHFLADFEARDLEEAVRMIRRALLQGRTQ